MRISDWSSDVCSSDLRIIKLRQNHLLYDVNGQQNHQRRQVQRAEIRHDPADRPVYRHGYMVEHDDHIANKILVGVADIKGDHTGSTHLNDNGQPDDIERINDDLKYWDQPRFLRPDKDRKRALQ